MPAQNNLTLTDIEFLRSVEELNNNPKKHRDTDIGEMPANTTSIRKNTDLTQEQVKYRMGGNGNSRGFEIETEEMPQIIISHSAKPTDKGFGPRSVELTSKGQEILREAEEIVSNITNVTRVINEEKNVNDGIHRAKIKVNEIINVISYDLNHPVTLITDPTTDLLLIVERADGQEPSSGLWYDYDSDSLKLGYYLGSDLEDVTPYSMDASATNIAEALCDITADDPPI